MAPPQLSLVATTRPSPGVVLLTLQSEPRCPPPDRAVIESGLARDVFTAGNDITEIYPRTTTAERAQRFWTLQNTFLARLYRSRLATVAVLRGACPAGGCCLALACDYRIFLEGAPRAAIGLNEPVLGIPVPEFWMELLKRTVGDRAAEQMGIVGRMVGPREALEMGLVDRVVGAEGGRDGLREAALAAAAEFLKVPPRGRVITKIRSRSALADAWGDPARLAREANEKWQIVMEPEVMNAMGRYLERLSASKTKPKLLRVVYAKQPTVPTSRTSAAKILDGPSRLARATGRRQAKQQQHPLPRPATGHTALPSGSKEAYSPPDMRFVLSWTTASLDATPRRRHPVCNMPGLLENLAAVTIAVSATAGSAAAHAIGRRSSSKWGLDAGASTGSGTLSSVSVASMPAECVSLAQTTACSPWNEGLYLNISKISSVYGLNLKTAAQWDAVVTEVTSGGKYQADLWRDYLACNGYTGTPLQYQRSYNCITDIFFFSAGCNAAAKAALPTTPLCAESCKKYGEAVNGLLGDTSECPPTNSNAAGREIAERRAGVANGANSCNFIVSQWTDASGGSFNPMCIKGVSDDQNSCGFGGNVVAARDFCQDVDYKVSCCSDFKNAMQNGFVFKNFTTIKTNLDADVFGVQTDLGGAPRAFDANHPNAEFANDVHRPGTVAAMIHSLSSFFALPQALSNKIPKAKPLSFVVNDGASMAPASSTNATDTGSSSSGPSVSIPLAIGLSVGALVLVVGLATAGFMALNRGRRSRNPYRVSIKRGVLSVNGKPGLGATGASVTPTGSPPNGFADDRKLIPGSGNPTPDHPERYKVTFGYTPSLPDEMELKVGQIIEVAESFDDGWGKGRNLNTGVTGIFPMACLARI
ncbi:hypothetical protein DFJ73DRAFT_798741 [Zopfochytrium polystomum]|nr:hypothetical protein DFJ73DRAFT_798741 [Zopfochytrium polystomum]